MWRSIERTCSRPGGWPSPLMHCISIQTTQRIGGIEAVTRRQMLSNPTNLKARQRRLSQQQQERLPQPPYYDRRNSVHHSQQSSMASFNFFESADLGQVSNSNRSYATVSPAMSRKSSFSSIASLGSMDSGVSHPPRDKREGKKVVKIRFSDLTNQSNKNSMMEAADTRNKQMPMSSVSSLGDSSNRKSPDNGCNMTEASASSAIIFPYIHGPDASDGKWVCSYEDCGKRFRRSENIKSHVQTHLEDRRFQCPTCKKRFVRQHDLKRHAKIHVGTKPYPCDCGNSFARQDALVRHRLRGMCIGAFNEITRKFIKRGHPRYGPDMEARMDKSARTREKNTSTNPVSSVSGFSDGSSVNSLDDDYNNLDDMEEMGIPPRTQHLSLVSPTTGTLSLDMSDLDKDLLLRLGREPSTSMMRKFDEEFDNAGGMFTNDDDAFLGST